MVDFFLWGISALLSTPSKLYKNWHWRGDYKIKYYYVFVSSEVLI